MLGPGHRQAVLQCRAPGVQGELSLRDFTLRLQMEILVVVPAGWGAGA